MAETKKLRQRISVVVITYTPLGATAYFSRMQVIRQGLRPMTDLNPKSFKVSIKTHQYLMIALRKMGASPVMAVQEFGLVLTFLIKPASKILIPGRDRIQ